MGRRAPGRGPASAAVAAALALAAAAHAQAPGEPAGSEPAAAVPASGGARAEVSIVAGNLASARRRALDEALYLAVDQALTSMLGELGLDPAAPPEPVRALRASLRADARRFVRSYRVASEGELPGAAPGAAARYQVTVEATVNEGALARELTRARGQPSPSPPAAAQALWVLGQGELREPVAQALAQARVAIAGQCPDCADPAGWRARAGAPVDAVGLLVAGEAAWRPPVQGADARAARCQGAASLLRADAPAESVAAAELGFGGDDGAATAACRSRLAQALAARLLPLLAAPASRPGTLVLHVQATPAALERLLSRMAGAAALGRAEPRRVALAEAGPGPVVAAELRVTTTLSATEFVRLLQRELQRELVLEPGGMDGSRVRVRAALPESPGPPAPPAAEGAPPA